MAGKMHLGCLRLILSAFTISGVLLVHFSKIRKKEEKDKELKELKAQRNLLISQLSNRPSESFSIQSTITSINNKIPKIETLIIELEGQIYNIIHALRKREITGKKGGLRKKKTRKKRGGKKERKKPNGIKQSQSQPQPQPQPQLNQRLQQLLRDLASAIVLFNHPNFNTLSEEDRTTFQAEYDQNIQELIQEGFTQQQIDIFLQQAHTAAQQGGRKKNTRKKRGGEKSKRVKKLIKVFQQYPEIFPSGYFRFLGARLQNHIDKKTLWYKNGVILTWIKYQKTVKKKPKCIIKPGDVKLDQIVNKNQGNGAAKKIVLQFLKKFEKNRIWLEVRANNKRAIKFYRDRGFKKVCNIKFGEIPGIMMVKN